MAAPGRAAAPSIKFTPQSGMVIDLAIVTKHEAARLRGHGLMTVGRQVNDCQASMREPDPCVRIAPDSGIVRTAMDDRVGHALELRGIEASTGPQAGYSAQG